MPPGGSELVLRASPTYSARKHVLVELRAPLPAEIRAPAPAAEEEP